MFLDSAENYKKKMEICKSCEDFIAHTQICGVCKCIMPLKARLVGNNCPKEKHKV